MKKNALVFLLSVGLFLSGCAMHPQNSQEFRESVPRNAYGKHETFEIQNSFSDAVSNFKSQYEKCLDTGVVVKTYTRLGAKMSEQTWVYTPTLVVGDVESELAVQQNVHGSATIAGKVPEKGMFILLADLRKSGPNESVLDVYRITYRGTDEMVSAIKNWASGESLDCPDLTK